MFSVLLFALLLLTGCMSAPKNLQPLDLTSPGWTTQQGQITWQRNRTAAEISGDLLIALNEDHSTFVRFSKDPFTIVNAQVTTNHWNIDFGDRYYFHGGARRPARFIWLYLPDLLLGTNKPPAGWLVTREDSQMTLLQNSKSGERLELFLPSRAGRKE